MSARDKSIGQGAERVLVTGGCGFLGCNIASALAESGREVVVLDNMARAGAQENADWLKRRYRERVTVEIGDVRDGSLVGALVADCGAVLHLAAQVAVTTSLQDPASDFEVNARGTLNLLEAVRRHNPTAPLIFASTNKVYGKLLGEDGVSRDGERYEPTDTRLAAGVSEKTPIDFYSPYGCSKGAADQYVHDYARVFGLRTVVLRMSCIYGPRQFGTEDQGWVAHFLLRAIADEEITLYGDGCQVRDVLFVDDAVDAWLKSLERIDEVKGSIFNLGGGPRNAVSLLEMLAMISALRGKAPRLKFADWRPGDQPWYVSDTEKISRALDWVPHTDVQDGLGRLEQWLDSRFGAVSATAA